MKPIQKLVRLGQQELQARLDQLARPVPPGQLVLEVPKAFRVSRVLLAQQACVARPELQDQKVQLRLLLERPDLLVQLVPQDLRVPKVSKVLLRLFLVLLVRKV